MLKKILFALIALAVVSTSFASCTPGDDDSAQDSVIQDGNSESKNSNGQTQPGKADGSSSGSSSTVTAARPAPGGNLLIEPNPQIDKTIELTVSEADLDSQPSAEAPSNIAESSPSNPDIAAQLEARLPALDISVDAKSTFHRPTETRLPPLVGETITTAFPPAAPSSNAPEAAQGPLQVLRYQPEGTVEIAPFIAITFDRPMVALDTHSSLDTVEVPISISPQIEGRWVWLGTKTARFEADSDAFDRLPKATNFTVKVDKGTKSANGSQLEEALEFNFNTPPAQLDSLYPINESLALDTIFVAKFNQNVEAKAALKAIALKQNGTDVELRLATDDEVAEDDSLKAARESDHAERYVFFTAKSGLQADSSIAIFVGPNTPSAEGPLLSETEQSYRGRTYAQFALTEAQCGWGQCHPTAPFSLYFNNPIDLEKFSPEMISVEPEIDNMNIQAHSYGITITGSTKAKQYYNVTVDASLSDTFGQTLLKDVTVDFAVGEGSPNFMIQAGEIVTVDPFGDDSISLLAYNLKEVRLEIWKPEIKAYGWFQRNRWELNNDTSVLDAWEKIGDELFALEGNETQITPHDLNLSSYFQSSKHLVVRISATVGNDPERVRSETLWVQKTDLNVDTFAHDEKLSFFVNSLSTGAPVANTKLEFISTNFVEMKLSDFEIPKATAELETQADGLAETTGNLTGYLVATNGEDQAITSEIYAASSHHQQMLGYVISDRGVYKPGEVAHLKGFVRNRGNEPSDLSVETSEINWRGFDDYGNEIGTGSLGLSVLGGFDLAVEIPADINLGHAYFEFYNENGSFSHYLMVQEFRRPEFEVTVEPAETSVALLDAATSFSASAAYYSGGALAASEVFWNLQASRSSYNPPGWPEYSFGVEQPWWIGPITRGYDSYWPGVQESISAQLTAKTNAAGIAGVEATVSLTERRQPILLAVDATVIDLNNQPITGRSQKIVHPAEVYVGLRSSAAFIRAGEELKIEAIAVDIDGQVAPKNTATLELIVLEQKVIDNEWTEVETVVETCEFTTTEEKHECTFTPENGGKYRVKAQVSDANGNTSESQITRWVAGDTNQPNTSVDADELTVVPDTDSDVLNVGDIAKVLVQAPYDNPTGVYVVANSTESRIEPIDFDKAGSAVVEIPITEADIGGIAVNFEVTGIKARDAAQPGEGMRPAYAIAAINFEVAAELHRLNIDAAVQDPFVEPGSTTVLDIAVRDANNNPVEGAEVVAIVVDEAVLALSNYELLDPISVFYPNLSPWVNTTFGRRMVMLANTPQDGGVEALNDGGAMSGAIVEDAMASTEMAMEAAPRAAMNAAPAPMGRSMAESEDKQALPVPTSADEAAGSTGADIALRSNFDALAAFSPELATDADGKTSVKITLPDSTTRYRIMVVAASQASDFGTNESNMTAQLPLIVRPTPPRFLNYGDSFEFPVTVQNNTNTDLDVDVLVRAENLKATGDTAKQITVPANGRAQVRFSYETESAGVVNWQVAAQSSAASASIESVADAASGKFDVYTPATSEAFATYGSLEAGTTAQPIAPITGVIEEFGGLSVTTSSTAVSALSDALLYLVDYPYESNASLASKLLAITAMKDLLAEFDQDVANYASQAQSRIDELVKRQRSDGGFDWWNSYNNQPSDPWVSLHALHAFINAQKAGYAVPNDTLQRSLAYAATIEAHIPEIYSQRSKVLLRSYAVYLSDLAGEANEDKAVVLWKELQETPQLDAIAFIWPTLANTPHDGDIERFFANRVTEDAKGTTFVSEYHDDKHLILASQQRTDAIILQALLTQRPNSDLVLKTLNSLMAGRDLRGRWHDLSANVFVLMAASSYFEQYESVSPDFIARVWLGDDYVAEHGFSGRETTRQETLVPMDLLVQHTNADNSTAQTATNETDTNTDVVIQNDGVGRLYWRLGLSYAPAELDLEARDQGFVVQRSYEAVDDEDDVKQNDDGTWQIKEGARVRVKLTMVADQNRAHVALVDPMPGGFEAINPALATSETVPKVQDDEDSDFGRFGWWYNWFNHQNLRDDRAEAFANYLYAGVYEYSYVARATTVGEFVVPPTKAEERYEPENFGRSSSTTVTVVANN